MSSEQPQPAMSSSPIQEPASDLAQSLEYNIDANIEQVSKWVDFVTEFAIQYGFQILGAVVFFLIGLKVSTLIGRRITQVCEDKDIDVTLARFIGSVVKIALLTVLIIITLGNFGVSIAPLIALAGAGAFGATVAIQGPLSNYGAGISIILSRPFTVGSTILVNGVSGVVEEVTLAHTRLRGEDGEFITIPNKKIVGEIIVNSDQNRIIESKIALAAGADADLATKVVIEAVAKAEGVCETPIPQAGIIDFTYGGMILGVRAWAPSQTFFQTRFAANKAAVEALRSADIPLLQAGVPAVLAENLSVTPDIDMGRAQPE